MLRNACNLGEVRRRIAEDTLVAARPERTPLLASCPPCRRNAYAASLACTVIHSAASHCATSQRPPHNSLMLFDRAKRAGLALPHSAAIGGASCQVARAHRLESDIALPVFYSPRLPILRQAAAHPNMCVLLPPSRSTDDHEATALDATVRKDRARADSESEVPDSIRGWCPHCQWPSPSPLIRPPLWPRFRQTGDAASPHPQRSVR